MPSMGPRLCPGPGRLDSVMSIDAHELSRASRESAASSFVYATHVAVETEASHWLALLPRAVGVTPFDSGHGGVPEGRGAIQLTVNRSEMRARYIVRRRFTSAGGRGHCTTSPPFLGCSSPQ